MGRVRVCEIYVYVVGHVVCSLVPRLLPSFLSHTVPKKLWRSLGTRVGSLLVRGKLSYDFLCSKGFIRIKHSIHHTHKHTHNTLPSGRVRSTHNVSTETEHQSTVISLSVFQPHYVQVPGDDR